MGGVRGELERVGEEVWEGGVKVGWGDMGWRGERMTGGGRSGGIGGGPIRVVKLGRGAKEGGVARDDKDKAGE